MVAASAAGKRGTRSTSPIPVLAETAGWIAADKPPGVTVIPGRGEDPDASLRRRLERQRGERFFVVHRLDRDTSGLVLFARDAVTHRALSIAFEEGRVEKTYLAITRGIPAPREGTIDRALHRARRGKMRPAAPHEADALEARTDYRVLKGWETPDGPVALVELRPRTGRQHQIRVHLRSIDTPLFVDPLYAGGGSPPPPGRLTLHAARLFFVDPGTGERIELESPLPCDLVALCERFDGVST